MTDFELKILKVVGLIFTVLIAGIIADLGISALHSISNLFANAYSDKIMWLESNRFTLVLGTALVTAVVVSIMLKIGNSSLRCHLCDSRLSNREIKFCKRNYLRPTCRDCQ